MEDKTFVEKKILCSQCGRKFDKVIRLGVNGKRLGCSKPDKCESCKKTNAYIAQGIRRVTNKKITRRNKKRTVNGKNVVHTLSYFLKLKKEVEKNGYVKEIKS